MADPGDGRDVPPRSNFFHFHTVSTNILSNNRLALPGNPASDTWNEMIILLKQESFFSSDPSIWQVIAVSEQE